MEDATLEWVDWFNNRRLLEPIGNIAPAEAKLKKVAIPQNQPFIGDTDDLTIEHLLPQSIVKSDGDEFVVGKIGNLMLIDAQTNGMLSTNDYKQKKAILLDRGCKLPDILESAEDITEEVINENTMRISELARSTIWRL